MAPTEEAGGEGPTRTASVESSLSDDGETGVSTLFKVLLICLTRALLDFCAFFHPRLLSLFSRSSNTATGFSLLRNIRASSFYTLHVSVDSS